MEISKEKAEKTLQKSKSKTEWAALLGMKHFNGATIKKLQCLINKYNLDISHFDLGASRRKWPKIKKVCPVCQTEFETQKGHPREKTVCSRSCSNTHFASLRYTEEANEKTRQSMIAWAEKSGKYIKKTANCLRCEKEFVKTRKTHKYCSKSCGSKNRKVTNKTRQKLRQVQLKLIEEGKHKGWQSRDKCKRSYAEEYVTQIFKKNGIIEGQDYEFEYRQDKWFIDFAFVEDKIAIEIDGKQHNYPERKIKDQEKDKYLEEQGWKVFRIKWKRPSLKTRKHLLNRLNEVLDVEIKDDTL